MIEMKREKSEMQNNKLKEHTDRRVLIFPTAGMSEKNVYFLFSVTQVEDIIKEILIHPIPFSPSYTEGIAQWRDHVVPVISLEKCLGGESENSYFQSPLENKNESTRLMIIQSTEGKEKRRVIIRVISSIRMFSLPISCTPISSVEWITNKHLVRAVYEWEEGYLVVPYVGRILEIGIEN